MKKTIALILVLAAMSACSGYLMSKVSWIGKVGMTFFYKEYNLLKIWWQGGAAVFIVIMALFLLHTLLHNKLRFMAAKAVHFLLLLAAVAGLFLTYTDFNHDYAHHLLGRRFHSGFYIAWAEWLLICLFFLFKRRKSIVIVANKTETITA